MQESKGEWEPLVKMETQEGQDLPELVVNLDLLVCKDKREQLALQDLMENLENQETKDNMVIWEPKEPKERQERLVRMVASETEEWTDQSELQETREQLARSDYPDHQEKMGIQDAMGRMAHLDLLEPMVVQV